MCEMTTALAVAGQAAKFASGMAASDAAATNRAYAISDYTRQISEAQKNYVAETRAANQAGFDETLKMRSAKATARAEAATQGAAGVSVDAVLNEITGVGARSLSRIDDRKDTLARNYQNTTDSAYATAASRVNANKDTSGSNLLSLAIGTGTALSDGGYL